MNEIRVRKQTEDGQLHSFEGLISHFTAECPDLLRQIESTDICVIEVYSDVDPQEIAKLFDFIGTAQIDVDSEELENFEVFSPDDDIQIPGVIRRAVMVLYPEHRTQYELIGLEDGSNIVLFAMTPPYQCNYLYEWFGKDCNLLYNFWFSEGPGPVSWEGEFALFRLREYLLVASAGDSQEDFTVKKIGNDLDITNALLDWLVDHGNLVQFILKTIEPRWEDDALKSRLKNAVGAIEEQEELLINLSPDQISLVLDKINSSLNFPEARIIQLLGIDIDPKVSLLVDYVEQVAEGKPEYLLTSLGDFLEEFQI